MAKKKAVAKTNGNGGVPSYLKDYAGDAGKGTSSAQEDNLVPLIYVLQATSPQAVKRNPEYIEGAEAGAIWLRNSEQPLVSGEEGILFQPCFFYKDWVEWIPRDSGGGLVGRSDDCPAEAKEVQDPQNPKMKRYVLPNGNDVIETRYHIGYVFLDDGRALPYVIPLKGSGHSFSKAWMFMQNGKQGPDGTYASWTFLYRLTTKFRSNNMGDWYMFEAAEANHNGPKNSWVTEEQYKRGAKLNAAFERGSKKAEDESSEATHEGEAAM